MQGVKGMRVGGQRQLIIPPKLAYGDDGSPPVHMRAHARARARVHVRLCTHVYACTRACMCTCMCLCAVAIGHTASRDSDL